jgi:hypothetical protein
MTVHQILMTTRRRRGSLDFIADLVIAIVEAVLEGW